ncbi:MAG: M43 family zinc metalloprotease [Sphingobacteriales bacterium JAD_PAG50586_3]|nr:MAG: M43 family zinc metalloprotease [Sphingobacteriales bacterium JAD_PAG50586_3]
MTKFFISALSLLLAGSVAYAQVPCGTTKAVQDALTIRPQGIIDMQNLETETENFVPTNARAIKVIPVVVHIIHNYGPENVSKAQVLNAISILNRDFQKLNADTAQVIQTFKGRVAAPDFEFRLAKIDPAGNCTDGITRTVSDLTFSADDNVKDLISWPTNKYFNIWVVDRISFGAGGYAYLPGSSPCNGCDGVVVLNTQFGNIGTSNGGNFSERTLTHEAGHWFNLNHTWGSNNDCGSSCNGTDNVNDTPKTNGSCLTCDLAQNDCGVLANVQNYMDYSTCTVMFTSGQATRMQAAATSSVGGRNNLSSNANLIATGTNDGFVVSPCAPIADFLYDPSRTCAGSSVTFTDVSYGADVDQTWEWNWDLPGATPPTSSDQNPTVTYPNPGTYNVTLTATNSGGSNAVTKSQIIKVYPSPGIQTMPLIEGFETAQFPVNPSNNLLNWEISPTTGTTWTRTTTAAATGSASISVNCALLDSSEKREFLSPVMDMTTTTQSPLELTFKVAYRYNGNTNDVLKVYISTNCGETWQVRYSKTGAQLATVANGTGNFVPPAGSGWRTETVNINGLANKDAAMIRFELTADGQGQRLYVDDINIGGQGVGISEQTTTNLGLNVYPNPITNQTLININSAKGGMATLHLFDVTGRSIAARTITMQANNATTLDFSSIAPALPAGVYNLRLQMDGAVVNRRVVVSQ